MNCNLEAHVELIKKLLSICSAPHISKEKKAQLIGAVQADMVAQWSEALTTKQEGNSK